ncbi:MAG TPA: AAA family ATPase [Anaerolineae bacterium]|nr:AAA family ATPase [Anaerolineae bacterium]
MPGLLTPDVRICLLGRIEVARGDRVLRANDWSRRKAQTLLARLAIEPSRRLLKDQALDLLWPDQTVAAASNNLYRTLHSLRQTLDTHLGPGSANSMITYEDGVFTLGDSVQIDAAEFERLCSTPATSESRIPNLQSALSLYRGDLLPDDLYSDWTLSPRESLRRLHREASITLAHHRIQSRDYPAAIVLLLPLIDRDRADEPVHRSLMRAYALAGRRHDALRQYQACVDALAADLDLPPEPETTALYDQILSGELSPAPEPVTATRNALPAIVLKIAHSDHLIGRDTEFETLIGWLRAAGQGQGSTILVGGDSGVGKTLLAAETLCASAGSGMTPLFGAAYEQEGQLAYQPFVEAFDRYLADSGGLPDENPITHFKRTGSDPQQEQWALFNAVAMFLTDLAKGSPVVLLIDDLHAADEASLRLFHYLARQTRKTPVALLATYRADLAAAAVPFGTLLNALYRERLSETLALDRLPKEDVARLLAHTLGGDATPALVDAVYEIGEGNPFFIQELSRALIDEEQIERRDSQWHLIEGKELRVPTGLSGLLRERVHRLGPSVGAALTTAAVIGREFGFDVLRATAELPDSVLLDALDTALAGQLLDETESGYRFRHILIRRVLYDSLSRARRAHLHGHAAEAIESVYARRPGRLAPHIEDLAHHYDRSDRRERALNYLIEAGRKAARVFAFEVAADYYERALALLDALGLPEAAQRFHLLEQLGKYYKVLADTPKAVAAFERALDVSGEGWKPRACDRARTRRLAAMGLLTAGRLDEAEIQLQRALTELSGEGEEDEIELANVLYNVAQLHWHRNEYRAAFDVAQRSLAVAERVNDREAIARAFEMLALACHSLGEWQTGMDYEQKRAALVGPGLDVGDAFDVHL